MKKPHIAYLLLGGNIHSRTAYLDKGITLIGNRVGKIIRQSSVYESEPWGFETPVAFLNQVVCVETGLAPLELLKVTQAIEQDAGRTEKTQNTGYVSRTLDIDILFYDEEQIDFPELTIPHARLADRKFTLIPLAEIAPEKIHPVLQKSCAELLFACTDKGSVWKFKEKQAHAV